MSKLTTPKYLAHKTRVLGNNWLVYYCQPKYYRKLWGTDSIGMTDTELRIIYLINKRVTFEVVAHELWHAYCEEVCVTPASLTAEQMEEVSADIAGKYGRHIMKQAEQIVNAYTILRDKLNESRKRL